MNGLHYFSVNRLENFKPVYQRLLMLLTTLKPVNRGEWQAQRTADRPEMHTCELANVTVTMPIPLDATSLANATGANLPWAEDHFQERV